MAYGTVKVDNITFTNGGVDQTITVSGIVQSISGDITATGTIQAATIVGTSTVSGATVTGNAGVFTTLTGGTAGFTTVTGTTVTGSNANFVSGVFSAQVSGATITGNLAQFTTLTGNTAGFTTVTGTTVTGTTANFATISGTTITGGAVTVASGIYTGNVTAAAFIPTGSTVPTNGLYLPSANSVALSTNGTGRLFIGATGNVGINNAAPSYLFDVNGQIRFGSPNQFFTETNALSGAVGQNGAYIRAAASVATNPTYSNCDDQNTGIFFPSTDTLGLSTGGLERLRITSTGQLSHIGAGSSGSPAVAFNGSAPSNSLVVTSTGNVGVGTSSPIYKFSVIDGGSTWYLRDNNDDAEFLVTSEAGQECVMYFGDTVDPIRGGVKYNSANDALTLQGYNNTERLRVRADGTVDINGAGTAGSSPAVSFSGSANSNSLVVDSSSRVGIGTSSPQVALQVGGTTAASQVRIYGGSAGSTYPELQLYAASSDHNWTIRGNHATNLTIGKGTFGNYGSDLITITAGGSVGIGTTNPSEKLTVADGSIQIESSTTSGAGLRLKFKPGFSGTYGNQYIAAINGELRIGASTVGGSNAFTTFYGQAGTEQARIDGSGNLGVGVTSPAIASFGNVIRNKAGAGLGAAGYFAEGANSDTWFGIYSGTGTGDSAALVYPSTGSLRIATTTGVGVGGFSEKVRIDSSGRLLVGTSSARSIATLGTNYQALIEKAGDYAGFSVFGNKANNQGSYFVLGKSRGTTAGAVNAVAADDVLGYIGFEGTDGTSSIRAADIFVAVDGTPGANDMPGRLVFSTTADGAATPTERLRITSTGQVRLAGAGITFNGDTATANELDDYEEGTWTPTATPSTSGTITLSGITASYTKIGNTVSIRMFATVSAVSSPLGYIDISLPFTNSGSAAGSVLFYNGDTGAVMSNFIGRVSGNVFRITYGTGQVGTGSASYARANSEIDIAAVYRN